jgi:uncharacterized protein YqeY
MSPTREKIDAALKRAMKARDEVGVRSLRLLVSDLKRIEIDERRDLSEDEVLQVVQRAIKRRRETIDLAESQGRADITSAERAEISALEPFLPSQLSDAELVQIIEDVIRETGATTRREQGKVMGVLMPRIQGRADGKVAARLVSERLALE